MKKRVVVTGLGAITPVGNSVDTFWESIKAGKSGIGEITAFDTEAYKVHIAGEVKGFDPLDCMDKKEARRMSRFSQLAIAATKEAIEHSKINISEIDPDRIGVIIGSGIGGLGTMEIQEQQLLSKGPNKVSPLLIPMIIANMAAGNIAIRFGVKGICKSVVSACASSTHSVGDAFRAIQYGDADVIIAGGTESTIVPLGLAGFIKLNALSMNTDPLNASRPFDKNRDGFVMGEGAGTLVLEELEHAKRRGATIFAEVMGYGSTCDAYHITASHPEGDGATRAMKLAMKDAGIEPEDVSYINAHGTSTQINDEVETIAIKRALGEHAYRVPISSTKSMVGHLLGGAGAVELIACIKSIEEQYIHPTTGYTTPDEVCDLDYVPHEGRKADVGYVLSNSIGFGGHNATVCIQPYR